jgi:hypothetical protein
VTSSDRGRGANLPDDAIYPTAFLDGDGRPLNSTNRYVLHFDKGKLPPADAFWSTTMYDEQGFQVSNPSDRFAIGDRDKLTFNVDGSLDLYIRATPPGRTRSRTGCQRRRRRRSRPRCVSTHHVRNR